MADQITIEGCLKIYQNGELIRDLGTNIILDHFRIALARLLSQTTGRGEIFNAPREFQGVEEAKKAVDGVIPHSIALDNKGAWLDGQRATTRSDSGNWEIDDTNSTDYVDTPGYAFIFDNSSKQIQNETIVTTTFNLAGYQSRERLVTRATLVSRDGQPMATKHFEGFVLAGDEVTIDWSIGF